MVECLRQHVSHPDMPFECQKELMKDQFVSASTMAFDLPLAKKCYVDANRLCPTLVSEKGEMPWGKVLGQGMPDMVKVGCNCFRSFWFCRYFFTKSCCQRSRLHDIFTNATVLLCYL